VQQHMQIAIAIFLLALLIPVTLLLRGWFDAPLVGAIGVALVTAAWWAGVRRGRWFLAAAAAMGGGLILLVAINNEYWSYMVEERITVLVTVLDRDGDPLPNVVCELFDCRQMAVIDRVATADNGKCGLTGGLQVEGAIRALRKFEKLPRGEYAVRLRRLGTEDQVIPLDDTTVLEQVVSVSARLPRGTAQPGSGSERSEKDRHNP